ncbi:PepSY domain-containing protein [Methylobacterium sp. 77]|uniref:PepSY domain-containing protein n=1 Tax=Methylobacterium sp. 77 TaxID=1101192 RepID=UPI00037414B0|nr:PepSY domain-containing protein [Methylobacterium sp. 77]
MSFKTAGLAAIALGFALTGTAFADRAPTPDELTKIEATLKKEGFTKWGKIEVEEHEIDVDNAIDANGKQFDLELDPKTYAITSREAE